MFLLLLFCFFSYENVLARSFSLFFAFFSSRSDEKERVRVRERLTKTVEQMRDCIRVSERQKEPREKKSFHDLVEAIIYEGRRERGKKRRRQNKTNI